MQAASRKVHHPAAAAVRRLGLEAVDAVEPHPLRLRAVGIEVGERRGMAAVVPLLAADRAGMTADADVEVDDEAELLSRRARIGRHRAPRSEEHTSELQS